METIIDPRYFARAKTDMKRFFFCIALVFGMACGAVRAQTAPTDIDEALKVAQAKQLPVFIDFSAIWCHSCHAMDAQVLNGPDWNKRQSRFVLVRSDADSVNGSTWMHKLHVPALPTYVMLNPDGSERGRLTGEFTRAKFYPALDRLLNGQDALSKLEPEAAQGSADAAAKVLRAYDERDQQQEGLHWYTGLPETAQKAIQGNAEAATWLAVLQAHGEMRKAIFSQPKVSTRERTRLLKDCRLHAQQALHGPLELDQRFDIASTLLECAGNLPASQQKALASAQLPALKALYDKDVPTAGSGTLRDATYTLAYYYKAVGDTAAENATYARAIAIGRKALDDGHGGFDVKRDQAMAEVLGEFLGRHGAKNEDVALEKAMVEAYPDNASYQAQYGDSLLKQGDAAAALPYLQRATNNASDQDKLGYTYSLAKALIALHRRPEAEKLFNKALQTAKKQFPEMTKIQMAYWKQTGSML